MKVNLQCLGFVEKSVRAQKLAKKTPSPFEDYFTGLQEDSLLGSQGLKLIILSLCSRQSGCVVPPSH